MKLDCGRIVNTLTENTGYRYGRYPDIEYIDIEYPDIITEYG